MCIELTSTMSSVDFNCFGEYYDDKNGRYLLEEFATIQGTRVHIKSEHDVRTNKGCILRGKLDDIYCSALTK